MGIAAIVYLLLTESKEIYSTNITLHAVSSVARYATTTVEIFRPSQKWDLCGVVAVPVSEANF